jgi:hypothetical protein
MALNISQHGRGFMSFLDLSKGSEPSLSLLVDWNVPKAAVFRVPKGRFLPETGSQTSISPSNIMLRRRFIFG